MGFLWVLKYFFNFGIFETFEISMLHKTNFHIFLFIAYNLDKVCLLEPSMDCQEVLTSVNIKQNQIFHRFTWST